MTILNLNNELAILNIFGEDSVKFLQGQFTNDVTLLHDNEYQFTGYLNLKGRLLVTGWLYRVSMNNYYFIITKEISEKILVRLKMYILRAKVVINLLSKQIFFLNNALNDLKDDDLQLVFTNNVSICITQNEMKDYIYDTNLWKKFLVTYEYPLIYHESQEKLLPLYINFEALQAVNFKKGCYVGQEIVARMHYLGHIKRSMHKFQSQYKVHIGQIVVSPILDNQEVGIIIDAFFDDKNYIGLISLQNNCTESVYLDLDNKQSITILKA